MKVGIIGPSKLGSLEKVNENAKEIIKKLAIKLSEGGHEIFITPDKGSAPELFAQKYLKVKGKKVWEVLPEDDTEFGYKKWINTELGEIINCGTWRNQPEKLNEETKAFVCIGYSGGVLTEIAYSKYFNPKPIYIINELVSGKLPVEISKRFDLRYVSVDDLKL